MVLTKAIFFERDGVLNRFVNMGHKPYPPLRVSDVRFVEETKEIIEKFRSEYLIIGVTVQSDVGNNIITRSKMDVINNHIHLDMRLDNIFSCYHGDGQPCNCKFPKPGLFFTARREYNINFDESVFYCYTKEAKEAGKKAGIKTIFCIGEDE